MSQLCTLISLFQEQWILMLQVTVKQIFANVHQTITHMPLPKTLINTFRTITHMCLHLSTLKYIRITCRNGNCNFMASHAFQQEIHTLLADKKQTYELIMH